MVARVPTGPFTEEAEVEMPFEDPGAGVWLNGYSESRAVRWGADGARAWPPSELMGFGTFSVRPEVIGKEPWKASSWHPSAPIDGFAHEPRSRVCSGVRSTFRDGDRDMSLGCKSKSVSDAPGSSSASQWICDSPICFP